jgi:ABC-2 type transport system permease protein
MKSLLKLTIVDIKLYLRNIIATFFTLAFPLLMLVLFGSIYGNQPEAIFGGRGSIDLSVPGYIATLIIGTTAFLSLPVDLALQRQLGVLRRMRATPLRAGTVLGSKLITNFLITVLGITVLVFSGAVLYHAALPADWGMVFLGILLSCASMFSLGFALASVIRSANAVRAVSFIVFYPMMFFSGGTLPSQFLPEAVKSIARVMPMTYAVNLLHDLWFGSGWDVTAVLALLGFMAAGILISVRFFRWE